MPRHRGGGRLEGVQQPHREDVYAHDVRWGKRILDALFVLHYLMAISNQLSFSFSIQLKALNLSIFCQGLERDQWEGLERDQREELERDQREGLEHDQREELDECWCVTKGLA